MVESRILNVGIIGKHAVVLGLLQPGNLHSYPYQALIRTWIPNVLFLQRVRMQKLINGSMQNVSRSGEKGGPPAVGWWWKVESSMLG